MNSTSPMIETQGLTRDFKTNRAVNELDISIQPGELFGLIGPDGAGKTTCLRILAGLLNITSGSAQVAGFDLKDQAEAIKSKIGYMAQEFSLYAELSVLENLNFFAQLYDIEPDQIAPRSERLLRFAGLTEFEYRRAVQLSGGMQKKLSLVCSLIHQPPILLLDEPTTGVDPLSRREFWNILNELHMQGTTIVISTPYMDEADRCSRVGLMYAGKIVVCSSPNQIRSQVESELIKLIPSDWQAAAEILARLPGVVEVQTYGESLNILVDSAETRLPQIERALKDHAITYHDARQASVSMEEAFISLIRRMEG